VLDSGAALSWSLSGMQNWKLVKPKREITLYRYTYEYSDTEVLSSNWTSREDSLGRKVLKTETKTMELEI